MLEVVTMIGRFVIIIENHDVVVGHPLTEAAGVVVFFSDSGISVRRV